jgi:hypothetical protein
MRLNWIPKALDKVLIAVVFANPGTLTALISSYGGALKTM